MKRRKVIIASGVVLLVAGGIAWSVHRHHDQPAAYATATLARGEIVEMVRASGVVRPLRVVQVGAQVNGPIAKLMADYNDTVTTGQIIAQINPAASAAHVGQSQAAVTQSEASVDEARARLAQADIELTRAGELTGKSLIPQSELDSAKANRDVLAAQLRLAAAHLEQSRAALSLAQTDLDYTTIRSPVNGVVLERSVSEGQTVVSSMSAQNLFTIAADLTTVLVEVRVPEADIGRIRQEQPVTFSVDAFADTFTGVVQQVRLSGTSVQNVVTYSVIVAAPNPDNKLLPGMTANLSCEVARHADVLKAPNAALRFRPATPESAKAGSAKEGGEGGPRPAAKRTLGPQLWVVGEDGPKAISIKTGITDGAFTEILEPTPLQVGQDVIIGVGEKGQASADKVNPFAPSFPRHGRRIR